MNLVVKGSATNKTSAPAMALPTRAKFRRSLLNAKRRLNFGEGTPEGEEIDDDVGKINDVNESEGHLAYSINYN